MDKYIIDGVEYSYGEEVEVRNDGYWCKRIFVGYIKNAIEPIICVSDTFEKEFRNEYEIIGYWKGSKEKTLFKENLLWRLAECLPSALPHYSASLNLPLNRLL